MISVEVSSLQLIFRDNIKALTTWKDCLVLMEFWKCFMMHFMCRPTISVFTRGVMPFYGRSSCLFNIFYVWICKWDATITRDVILESFKSVSCFMDLSRLVPGRTIKRFQWILNFQNRQNIIQNSCKKNLRKSEFENSKNSFIVAPFTKPPTTTTIWKFSPGIQRRRFS